MALLAALAAKAKLKSISQDNDMEKKYLIGAGGSDSQEPVRTPDTLLSQDYFELILGISQGPIKGLVSQNVPKTMENFFAGDTPAYSLVTGEANFSDFSATGYVGTDLDPPVELQLGGSAGNQSVNTPLASGIPLTRSTSSIQRGQFNRIELRINFPQLYTSNAEGVFETEAQLLIEYRPSTSGTWTLFEGQSVTKVVGKTTTGYVKEFIFDVEPQPTADYVIRITKLSPDGVQGVDDTIIVMSWESIQLVQKGTVQFDSLAWMHIYGKASNQFTQIPEFSGVYDGLLVKVPSNYNTELRTYDETVPWDGLFKVAYTNNPLWVLYELITHPEYGAAKYFRGAYADRYDFYQEAKWCDEMVSDGRGGTQPRYTFNEWLVEPQPGIEFLRYVAGSFGAIIVDDGNGLMNVRTDRERPAKQVFTPENVSAEGFNYTFTDVSTRYNEITAVFINPDLGWEEDRRTATIPNAAAIEQNGRVPYEFVAIGCTDAHEAIRRANLRYITANEEVASVSFVTSRFGLICGLFDTIYVADPDADWGVTGRVKSVVGNVINLRDPIYFGSTAARTIKIQTTDGLVSRTVTPPAVGETYFLTLAPGPGFPTATSPDKTVFVVEDAFDVGMAKPFRVMAVEEVEGSADKIRVTALEIAEGKHAAADSGAVYTPSQYSYKKPGAPVLPLAMQINAAAPIVGSDGSVQSRIEVVWVRPPAANTEHFEIDFKSLTDGTWRTEKSFGDRVYLSPVKDGEDYVVRLYAVSPAGQRSERCLQDTYTVLPPSGPAQAVLGFAGTVNVGGVTWGWNTAGEALYLETEIRAVNADWGSETVQPLFRGRADSFYEPVSTSGTLTRYARHLNTFGRTSVASASATVNVTTGDLSASGNDGLSYVPPSWAPAMVGGSGDLVIYLNRDAPGTPNPGEIYVSASKFYHPNGILVTSGINGAVVTSYGEGLAGRFFLVYTATANNTRFPAAFLLSTPVNLFIARITGSGTWEMVDNASNAFPFTPQASDCILCAFEAVLASGGINSMFSYLSGTAGASSKALRLVATSQIFQVPKSGSVAPTSITLTAAGVGLVGSPVFTVIAGTATLSGAANSRDLAYTNMSTDTATIRVVWDGMEDTITVAKVREGIDSVLAILTNQAHTVATDPAGAGGNYSSAGGSFKVYRGATDISTGAGVAYTVLPGATVSIAIDPSTGVYNVTGLSGDQGSATLRATVGSVVYDRQYSITKSKQGTSGSAGVSVTQVAVYQRSATGAPALPTNTATYSFTTGFTAPPNGGWSTSFPAGTAPLYVTVAAASSTTGVDTIAPGEWATPVLFVQNGSDGLTGVQSANLMLFRRSATASAPALPNASLTYTFASGALTGAGFNGWSSSVPPAAGGAYLYVTTAVALASAGVATDTILATEWAAAQIMAEIGSPGLSVYSATVYRQSATAPSTPTGGSFNFSTGAMVPPAGWSLTQPATTTTPTWACEFLFSTSTPSTTVTATTWTTPYIDAVAGSPGNNGESVLVFEVFQQAPTQPAVPTGGSYVFGTDTFVAPAGGWTRGMPASSTVPIWRTTFRFATSTPATPVAAGSWGTPVKVAQDGSPGAAGINNATISLYQRAVAAPPVPSATSTYTFASNTLTGVNNGWVRNVPAGTDPLWVIAATAVSSTASDTILSGEWTSPVKAAENGANGAPGFNSATVSLYQRTATPTPPALPPASVTYTFASAAATGLSGGWSQGLPTSGGAYRWYISAAAVSVTATDTILPAEWSTPVVLAQDGAEGPGTFTMVTSANAAWSNGVLSKTGNTATWNEGGRSAESFVGSAYVSFSANQTNNSVMVGLNQDPATDNDFASIDHAIFLQNNGQWSVRESGVEVALVGAYSTSDVFSVVADNDKIRYFRNGLLGYTSLVSAAGKTLFMDSSFVDVGSAVRNVRFGPSGAVGATGPTGLPGVNSATLTLYVRSVSAPPTPTLSSTYTFASGALTGINNGWTRSVPAGTDPVWVTSATAASSGASDTIAPAEWTTPVKFVENGTPGSNGINTATVYLYKRTGTEVAPALPTTTGTYTFASSTLTGVAEGWTTSLPAVGGKYRWVTTAAAVSSSGSDTILPAEWSAVSLLAEDGEEGQGVFTMVLPDINRITWASGVLTKISAGGDWNTHAYSAEAFVGGAYVSFSPNQTTAQVMVGLNTDPTANESYNTLDYAWYVNGSECRVYENALPAGPSQGTYSTSDVFAVVSDGEKVRYLRNGVVAYTSLVSPAGAKLHMDSSFVDVGAAVRNVKFGPSGLAGKEGQNFFTLIPHGTGSVAWEGGTLTRISGTEGWNTGGYSKESYLGSAFVSFSPAQANKDFMVALHQVPAENADYVTLNYAWFCTGGGLLFVYENGNNPVPSLSTYVAGDVLSIVADNDKVRYYKNGTLLYTSLVPVAGKRLYLDSSIVQNGAAINNLKFGPSGSAGKDGVGSSLSLKSWNFPAYSDGVVQSYVGATTTLSLNLAGADDSANWAYTNAKSDPAIGVSIGGSPSGRTVSITSVPNSVDNGWVDITATKAGFSPVTERFSFGKNKTSTPSAGPFIGSQNFAASGLRIFATGSVTVVSSVEFRSDGSVWAYGTTSGGSFVGTQVGSWYSPLSSGIGASYRIRFGSISSNGGTLTGSATGVEHLMDVDRTISMTHTSSSQFWFLRTLSYTITRVADSKQVSNGLIDFEILREF